MRDSKGTDIAERARTPKVPTFVHEDEDAVEEAEPSSRLTAVRAHREHKDSESNLSTLLQHRETGSEDVVGVQRGQVDPE